MLETRGLDLKKLVFILLLLFSFCCGCATTILPRGVGRFIQSHPELTVEQTDILRSGELVKGMTADQVAEAWGQPHEGVIGEDGNGTLTYKDHPQTWSSHLTNYDEARYHTAVSQNDYGTIMSLAIQYQNHPDMYHLTHFEKGVLVGGDRVVDLQQGNVREGQTEEDTPNYFFAKPIVVSGLAELVLNLMFDRSIAGRSYEFYTNVKEIFWWAEVTYSARPREFIAKWYDPSGNLYEEQNFKTAFGNRQLTKTSLLVEEHPPSQKPGKWVIEVYHKDELIEKRSFLIKELAKRTASEPTAVKVETPAEVEIPKSELPVIAQVPKPIESVPAPEPPKPKFKVISEKPILSSGFADEVSNLWLGGSVEGARRSFSRKSEKVVWWAELTNSLIERSFLAKWYDPDGELYLEKKFKNAFGNTRLAKTALKIKDEFPSQKPGQWVIEVYYKDKLIERRNFTILEK